MAQAERDDHERRLVAITDALMSRRLDWQGTTGPGFSLQEPDWPQERLARSLAATALGALAVAGPGHVEDVPVSAEPNPPKAGR